ncbi:hypothetical protein ACQP1G_36975 [Nocardia sp. CA-107356]|uniref:hypothetical protein n=1 Tax=Nocardia sp. CA-107356 TaxID=3239972 RepID=UPI003D8E516B
MNTKSVSVVNIRDGCTQSLRTCDDERWEELEPYLAYLPQLVSGLQAAIESPGSAVKDCVTTYMKVDWPHRAATIAETHTEDVVWHEQDRIGRKDLERRAEELRAENPDWVFRPVGALALNHCSGLFGMFRRSDRAPPGSQVRPEQPTS